MDDDWTQRDAALAAAREQVRMVFAPYGAHHPIPGCPHCITPADQAALAAGDLTRFAFKALTTWGELADFKHFLPRLLTVDLLLTLDKLRYAQWRQWPLREQQALDAYLAAHWEHQLVRYEDGADALDLLHTIGQSGGDPRPLLARWRQLALGAARAPLTQVLMVDAVYHLPTATDPTSQLLLAWLLEPATAALLEDAFFAAEGEEARALSAAIDRLALLADISGPQVRGDGGA